MSPTNSSVEGSKVATQKLGRTTKRVKVEHVTDANMEDGAALAKVRTKSSRSEAPNQLETCTIVSRETKPSLKH